MACPTLQLSDANGEIYNLTVADSGPPLATSDTLTTGTPNQVLTLCDIAYQNIFTIGVLTNGKLDYQPVGPLQVGGLQSAGGFANFIPISSPSFQWVITIDFNQAREAVITLVKVGKAPPPDPTVGQIFRKPGGPYPVLFQPNGVGTPVFLDPAGTIPQETIGEMLGMWSCGCGAFFNTPEVAFTTVGCQQAALVMCPICNFVSRIISPASLLYSFSNELVMP